MLDRRTTSMLLSDVADRIHARLHRPLWLQIGQILDDCQCKRVLDIGCGTGGLVAYLRAKGITVVGVDVSPSRLARAKRRDPDADWLLADAADLPFEGEFDAIVICFALHEMAPAKRERVWQRAKAAARPGARFLVIDYAPPNRESVRARLAAWWVEAEERAFLKSDPSHYRNYRKWMGSGGLTSWINREGASTRAVARYFWGSVVFADLAWRVSSGTDAVP